jgi:hypothetical protein
MTLLHPEFLIWGLLAIPLVLVAVVRRRVRHTASSGLVWDAVLAERTWFERARPLLGLAIRVAVLELLVVAAADPRIDTTDTDVVILVVDVSAGMQAPASRGSRFDEARAQLRRSIDDLHAGQRMALLSSGSVTNIACGLTADRRRLQAALDSIAPTDGSADLSAAIALAENLIPAGQHGRIVVATDSAAAPIAGRQASEIEWLLCGASAENVGITRCEIRPRPSNPAKVEVLIEVFNAGTRPVTCPLEIDFRGTPIDRTQAEIAPGKTFRKIQSIDDPHGGLLIARLSGSDALRADALAADNVAAAAVRERRRPHIVLVTSGNRAIEAALASLPGVDVTVVDKAPAAGAPADLLVWDGKVPAELPAGSNLVLAPGGSCDLWTLGTVATGSAVVVDQIELPPVAHVDFTQAVLEDPVRLNFKLPARSLVRSSAGDPIYSLLERPAGDVLVLHVRIDKTDLVARGMLPVLFADALRAFHLNTTRYEPSVTTADMVSIPPRDEARRLLPPQAARENVTVDRRLTVEPRQGIVGPLDRVGLWQVEPTPAEPADAYARPAASSAPTTIASQLTDRRQTDLNAALTGAGTSTGMALGSGRDSLWIWPWQRDGRLWPCFVLVALVLLAADGWLERRPREPS